jgi:signal transduction histidine kinase
MKTLYRILLIEDNEDDILFFKENLMELESAEMKNVRFELSTCGSLNQAEKKLLEEDFDVIMLDLVLPDSRGSETMSAFESYLFRIPTIVLTGLADEQTALQAVKKGAQDYLVKNQLSADLLLRSIRYAVERHKMVQDLKHSNEELERFASVVSHDLKTPLNSISGAAQIISMHLSEGMDPKGKEYLEMINQQVKWMASLIDGILEYSRISYQTVENVQKISLEDLIADVSTVVSGYENIEIIKEKEFPDIYGNKTEIRQVFQNLIDNAAKYMDKEKGKIILDVQDRKREWEFVVADNGPGISEEDFEMIFEIFRTVRRHSKGTGLGLALVKKIVEKYNGKIWVESVLGKGSSFHFTFPKNVE